jgi:hypothetical protein
MARWRPPPVEARVERERPFDRLGGVDVARPGGGGEDEDKGGPRVDLGLIEGIPEAARAWLIAILPANGK